MITIFPCVNLDYIKKYVYYNRFYIIVNIPIDKVFIIVQKVKLCRNAFTLVIINFIINLITLTFLCH